MTKNHNDTNIKEKLRQALISTVKVISEDFRKDIEIKNEKVTKELDFIDLDNLVTKKDFLKARATSDSVALKRKFSNANIYKKNLPSNSSCKSLYSIAEKIRYECLGAKMLKGIKKNLEDNYNQIIYSKKTEQPKSKDDVNISEAFELYMLKNFHKIKLNPLTSRMLNFWEKDFENSIEKHK